MQVYAILDEMFLAGEIEETNKPLVLRRLAQLDLLENEGIVKLTIRASFLTLQTLVGTRNARLLQAFTSVRFGCLLPSHSTYFSPFYLHARASLLF